jgi:hypothetical protein
MQRMLTLSTMLTKKEDMAISQVRIQSLFP